MTATFTIDRLKRLVERGRRGPDYVADCKACDIGDDPLSVTFDLDSPCYAALREKYDPAKSRGLGDTIAKITSAVGIKPCGGCKKRQAALNRMVPYS